MVGHGYGSVALGPRRQQRPRVSREFLGPENYTLTTATAPPCNTVLKGAKVRKCLGWKHCPRQAEVSTDTVASQTSVDQSPAAMKALVLAVEPSCPASEGSQDSWGPAPRRPAYRPPVLPRHHSAHLQIQEPTAVLCTMQLVVVVVVVVVVRFFNNDL